MALRTIVRIGHCAFRLCLARRPLLGTCRALCQFPIVAEKILEVIVVPLRRLGRPRAFQAGGDGVAAPSGAEAVSPTQPLLLRRRTFRLWAYVMIWICGSVSFSESVTACDQSNGLLIVHGHAAESLANVPRSSEGVWGSVRPFGVHVDQAHLHRAERLIQLAVAGIALVRQPF